MSLSAPPPFQTALAGDYDSITQGFSVSCPTETWCTDCKHNGSHLPGTRYWRLLDQPDAFDWALTRNRGNELSSASVQTTPGDSTVADVAPRAQRLIDAALARIVKKSPDSSLWKPLEIGAGPTHYMHSPPPLSA